MDPNYVASHKSVGGDDGSQRTRTVSLEIDGTQARL